MATGGVKSQCFSIHVDPQSTRHKHPTCTPQSTASAPHTDLKHHTTEKSIHTVFLFFLFIFRSNFGTREKCQERDTIPQNHYYIS